MESNANKQHFIERAGKRPVLLASVKAQKRREDGTLFEQPFPCTHLYVETIFPGSPAVVRDGREPGIIITVMRYVRLPDQAADEPMPVHERRVEATLLIPQDWDVVYTENELGDTLHTYRWPPRGNPFLPKTAKADNEVAAEGAPK
jgi:hypothetical protein